MCGLGVKSCALVTSTCRTRGVAGVGGACSARRCACGAAGGNVQAAVCAHSGAPCRLSRAAAMHASPPHPVHAIPPRASEAPCPRARRAREAHGCWCQAQRSRQTHHRAHVLLRSSLVGGLASGRGLVGRGPPTPPWPGARLRVSVVSKPVPRTRDSRRTRGRVFEALAKLRRQVAGFLFFFFFKYKNQGECFCPDARRGPCARAWGVPPGQPLFRWARGFERVVGGRAGVVSQAACGSGGGARGAAPLAEGQARHAASSVWRRADGAQRDGDAAQHRGRLGGGDDGQGHGRCQPGGRGALGLPRRPRLWHRHARRAEAAHSQGAGAAVEAPNRGCARALDASGGGRLSERGGAVAAGAARRGARRAARGARGAVSDLEAAR